MKGCELINSAWDNPPKENLDKNIGMRMFRM